MFKYSLDSKPLITDRKGNQIVDLAQSIFSRYAGSIQNFDIKRMASHAVMRPDLVSLGEYGHTESAEFILKYSGISNPFTLDEEDMLFIPNESEADMAMAVNSMETAEFEESARTAAIQNYFKFVNQDYKKNSESYDALENKVYESAIPDGNFSGDYMVPYIGDDQTAVTIRNGRMYFGEDAGISAANTISAATTNLDERIQGIIDSTAVALSDSNCLYNGVTLANFVKAQSQMNQNTRAVSDIQDQIQSEYQERINNEL